MEFSIFIQGYMPGPDCTQSGEGTRVPHEGNGVGEAADKHNWKYVWLSEPTRCPSSHLSANEAVAAICASTERIHIGSASSTCHRA